MKYVCSLFVFSVLMFLTVGIAFNITEHYSIYIGLLFSTIGTVFSFEMSRQVYRDVANNGGFE